MGLLPQRPVHRAGHQGARRLLLGALPHPSRLRREGRPRSRRALGVLLEPTSVVAKAWEQIDRIGGRAHWAPQHVVVTGAGPIGLLAALLGVQRGLDVHVIDQMTSGPQARPGARHSAPATTPGPSRPRCRHPDVVRGVHRGGRARVRRHGTPRPQRRGLPDGCVVGQPRDLDVDASLLNRAMVLENQTVVGSVNANRRHYEAAAAALAAADRPWLERLVTRRVPLEHWNARAGSAARRRQGRHRVRHVTVTAIAAGVDQIDTLLGGLGAGDRRLSGARGRPRAGGDGQPELGGGAPRRPRRARGGPRMTWPGWRSPTSTSTTPAGWVTWPGPFRRPRCTCTKRVRATWSTPPGSSTRRRASYGPLLDSLYGRLDPTPAERIHVLADGEEIRVSPTASSPPSTRPATPSTTWLCTTRSAASSSPATPWGCASPTPECCARPRPRPTSTSTRRSLAAALRGAPPGRPGPGPLRRRARPRRRAGRGRGDPARWAEVAERAWRAGEDIAAALDAAFAAELPTSTPCTARSSTP